MSLVWTPSHTQALKFYVLDRFDPEGRGKPTLALVPQSHLKEFWLPLSAFDISKDAKNGCQGLGKVWVRLDFQKGRIVGNSNQVTLQNLMTSIAMFMENWMKPCSISVQCWLWAALQGVCAFRVFEFEREHWNKISVHRQYQSYQAAHCWMRGWVHKDLMHGWCDCLLHWTCFLVGKPCNFWGIGQGAWNTLNILLFFDNLP